MYLFAQAARQPSRLWQPIVRSVLRGQCFWRVQQEVQAARVVKKVRE